VNVCDRSSADGQWPRYVALGKINLRSPGTYVLVMQLTNRHELCVGSLGEAAYTEGWYLYVGSALGGLKARLARHARHSKRLHWHVDYMLEVAELVKVWCHIGNERLECKWARVLGRMDGLTPSAVAFGASDCRCHTHLYRASERPSPHSFSSSLLLEGLDDRLWIIAPGT